MASRKIGPGEGGAKIIQFPKSRIRRMRKNEIKPFLLHTETDVQEVTKVLKKVADGFNVNLLRLLDLESQQRLYLHEGRVISVSSQMNMGIEAIVFSDMMGSRLPYHNEVSNYGFILYTQKLSTGKAMFCGFVDSLRGIDIHEELIRNIHSRYSWSRFAEELRGAIERIEE